MPYYEYECKECGTFEVQQKITEEPLKCCPNCGNVVKKIISVTAPPKFVGGGFYQTDYKPKRDNT